MKNIIWILKKAVIILAAVMLAGQTGFTAFAEEVYTDVTNLDELRAALETGGKFTLANDIAVDTHLLISDGVSVTLDLAGHTVDYSASSEECIDPDSPDQMVYGAIVVMEGGNLTIKDTVGNGMITGVGNGNTKESLAVYGTCTLQSGSLCGQIYVGDGWFDNYMGTFRMTGGSISGNCYLAHGANITMDDGKMENCFLEMRGDFTMNGGTISNHDAPKVVGIYGSGNCTFTMNAGMISGNDIENCVVDARDGFTMNGGRVSGSGQYGGVRTGYPDVLHISGNPKIDEYVYLDGGGIIWIDGSLTDGAFIPFKSPSRDYPVQITSGLSENGITYPANAFKNLIPGTDMAIENGEIVIKKHETEWDRLQEQFSAGGTVTVTLSQNYIATEADDTLTIPKWADMVLDLNGHTIDGSLLNKNIFTLKPGSYHPECDKTTLKIIDSRSGGRILCGANPFADIYNDSDITISGGTIEGSGSYVVDTLGTMATFHMTGGTIAGTHASHVAGSCVVGLARDNFTMTGGTISGTGCDSVIFNRGFEGNSSIMSGGTITGTDVTNIVYLEQYSDFIVSGGTIDGSNATNAVCVDWTADPDSICFAVSGSPTINGLVMLELSGGSEEAEPVTVPVTVTGALGSDISVSANRTSVIAKAGTGYTLTDSDKSHFKYSADAAAYPVLSNDGVRFNKSLAHESVSVDAIPGQTYSGNAFTPTVQVKDKDELLELDKDYTVTYSDNVNAGTASVKLSGKGGYYAGEKTAGFTIAPKPVTITGLSAENKAYDGTTAATVKGKAVISGRIGNDNVKASAGSAAFEDANVGNDKTVSFSGFRLSGTASGNYLLSSQPANVTANITKATPEITQVPMAGEITYGQQLRDSLLNGGTVKLNGNVVSGSFAWSDETIKPAVPDSNKTGYSVVFTPTDSQNLNENTCNVTLIVNKADIPADKVAPPTPKTQTLTYNGTAQELVDKGTVSGNIGTMWYAVTDSAVTAAPEFDGKSVSADKKWSTSIPAAKDAGTYKVWYKVEGDENHNPMAASQTPITVTIGKVDAATSAISAEKKYLYLRDNDDSFTLTGLPADSGTVTWKTPTANGLTFGPAPTVSDKGVLSYTVKAGEKNTNGTITVVAETQNYNDVTFTVNLKLVDKTPVKLKDGSSVSLKNSTLTYGQKLSALQFNTAEFVSDDTDQDIVEGTLTWKEPDTIQNAGTITAAWIFNPASEVYIPCEGTVTVNIDKAAINPGVSITGWTYGDPANSPSVTGNTGNGTVSYTYSIKGAESFSPEVPMNAGNFTVKAEIEESTNYLSGTATADFTIAQADSSVKKEAAAVSGLEYDGKAHKLIAAGEGNGGIMYYALGSDDSNAPMGSFSEALPEGTDAGTYYVWSKIKGDDNHKDTAAAFACGVSIAKNSHHPSVSLDAVTGAGDTREIDLSEYLEEEGTPGSPVITDGDEIFESSPAVNGNILKFTTVNDKGIIGKTAAISVPVNNSKNYETYNIDITVKVDDKFKQELSFAESEVTLKVDETFTNELSGAKTAVSYNSSDEKIATVDGTGKVMAVGAGTAVITAIAAETDEYFPASESYTVTVIEEKEEKEEDNEETALPEKKPDKVPFTETGENYASKEDNFAPVTGGSGGDIKNLLLDFSKVSESSVDPSGLKMTVINGSKLVTKGKLKDANSAKASGGVKVKVDKKTLIPRITCKKSGSVTLTMEDDTTYTINFTVEKPKAQKAAKNMSKGGAPETKTVTDLFGTHIEAGELSIVKQKQSQATVSDNSLIVDPKEKDSIKVQYKYLNKKYKTTIKVK